MIARVAVWEPMPDDDRQWVIDAAKTVPGVREAYHLVDPITGNGLSIAFFEDTVDVAAVKAAIGKEGQRDRLERCPPPLPQIPDHVQGGSQRIGGAADDRSDRARD